MVLTFFSKPRDSKKESRETILSVLFTMNVHFPKVQVSQLESNSVLNAMELPLIALIVITDVSL